MINRSFFVVTLCLLSNFTYASDLSGFYRCTGSKTILDNSVSATMERVGPIKIPTTSTALPPQTATMPAKVNAPSMVNQATSNAPAPIVTNPTGPSTNDVISSSTNDNALPLNAYINLRMLDNDNNLYTFTQINDDASTFWGKVYYTNDHLVATFDGSNKQQAQLHNGIMELQIKAEDGSFLGRFFIESSLKGSLSCTKV
jgi:hypothetical protein